MIIMENNKLLEKNIKIFLLNMIRENEKIKYKLKSREIIELGIHIKNMKLEDCLSLFENQNTEVNGHLLVNLLKYDLAAIGGALTLNKYFKGWRDTILKNASGRNKYFFQKRWTHGSQFKASIAGMVLYYIYNRLADECDRKAILTFDSVKSKQLKKQCRADSIRLILKKLEENKKYCKYTEDPKKCYDKYKHEYSKWTMKLNKVIKK